MELHKALRKQGLDVSKAQKGELRIAEDQAVEMRRRVELQVRVEGRKGMGGGRRWGGMVHEQKNDYVLSLADTD